MTKYVNAQLFHAQRLVNELGYYGFVLDPVDLLGILAELELSLTSSGSIALHAYEQEMKRPTKRVQGAEFPADYDFGALYVTGDDLAVHRCWDAEGHKVPPHPPLDADDQETIVRPTSIRAMLDGEDW